MHFIRSNFVLDARLAEDTHPVAELPLGSLRLMDDCNYPWLVLVPRVVDARELVDLDDVHQRELLQEIDRVSRLLQATFRPDKLNIAALGNVVPQLHVHLIARFRDDPAWPAPVWGRNDPRPYEPDALAARIRQLRDGLGCEEPPDRRRALA